VIRGLMAAACSRVAPSGGGVGAVGAYSFDDGSIPSFMSDATTNGWSVVTDASPDAGHTKALRAKAITHNETTQFTFQISTTSATSNFKVRCKISSESGSDYFRVLIDGTEKIKIAGNGAGYSEFPVSVTAGVHTVIFRYSKDYSVSTGFDTIFISLVTIA